MYIQVEAVGVYTSVGPARISSMTMELRAIKAEYTAAQECKNGGLMAFIMVMMTMMKMMMMIIYIQVDRG